MAGAGLPRGPALPSGHPAQCPHSSCRPPPLQALVPFHNLGLLIGLFSPRCADLWPATRQEAVSCVYSLLYLQLGYEGEPLAGQRCRGDEEQNLGLGWPGRTRPAPCPVLSLQASHETTGTTWPSGSSPSKMALCTPTLPSSSTPATASLRYLPARSRRDSGRSSVPLGALLGAVGPWAWRAGMGATAAFCHEAVWHRPRHPAAPRVWRALVPAGLGAPARAVLLLQAQPQL